MNGIIPLVIYVNGIIPLVIYVNVLSPWFMIYVLMFLGFSAPGKESFQTAATTTRRGSDTPGMIIHEV